MAFIKVKPAEGARIRQPNRNSRVMPPEGDMINSDDVFYARLIASGDIIVVDEKEAEPKGKEAKKRSE